MVYQYAFKDSSYIRADAQAAGEQCESLAAQGKLTARNLVDINRPEDAPLHGAFEWRNNVAAELYREQQARHIMNCLVVKSESAEPVRAFFAIERRDPVYRHIDAILESEDDTLALLRRAKSELQAVVRKYAQLKELAQVASAVEQIRIEESA